MNKFKEIRPIVLGIIIKNDKVLVSEGIDTVKNQIFYRALGGGIEFLETAPIALIREFSEEINIDITVLKKIDVVENIFVYEGKEAHEIIFLYEIDIEQSDIKEEYIVVEGKRRTVAKWVDREEFINGSKMLYPEIMKKYI